MEKEEINAQRKGKAKVPEEAPLQAIVLADSFSTDFHPITLERPKVLLPLVGVPMIDYTLTWLESKGIQEVFVFLAARSPQVIEYLKSSKWNSKPNFTVKTIESHNPFISVIALRNVIYGDFVLVSGDLVCKMPLKWAIREHKERRKLDNNAVMTMVVEFYSSSSDTNGMGVDDYTKQLLWYEDSDGRLYGAAPVENESNDRSMSLHNDLQDCYNDIRSPRFTDNFDYPRQHRHLSEDCYVAICSPEVLLPLLTDNFNYPDQLLHFVKGLLADDNMGYKIYTYEMKSSYMARIVTYRSYGSISNAIMDWCMLQYVSELVGDFTMIVRYETIRHVTDNQEPFYYYIGPYTFIREGTTIGHNTKISNSFIGNGCKIGSHVMIEGCYIWNDVTIEDSCELRDSIVCDGVIIKYGAVLERVVLSFKVVIGFNCSVPADSKVFLPQQRPDFWRPSSQLGDEGFGSIWSVAPIPDVQRAALNPDGSNTSNDSRYETFDDEVETTFLRAVVENSEVNDVIEKMKHIRVSWYMETKDCAGAIFFAVMNLGLEITRIGIGELNDNVAILITKWRELLQYFGKEIDDQIEMLLTFEEMCQESAKEFSPIFTTVLVLLYDKEVIVEEAILTWADEKKNADESDKIFLNKAKGFIQWLADAYEEED